MAFRTDRMAEIERKLDELIKENQELRRQLAIRMRKDGQCPGCQSSNIMHAETILDRSDSGRAAMAIVQPSIWSGRTEGEFEVYVCQNCGAVEWYVKSPQNLTVREKGRFTIRRHKPSPALCESPVDE